MSILPYPDTSPFSFLLARRVSLSFSSLLLLCVSPFGKKIPQRLLSIMSPAFLALGPLRTELTAVTIRRHDRPSPDPKAIAARARAAGGAAANGSTDADGSEGQRCLRGARARGAMEPWVARTAKTTPTTNTSASDVECRGAVRNRLCLLLGRRGFDSVPHLSFEYGDEGRG